MKSEISKRKTEHLKLASKAQDHGQSSSLLELGLSYEPCLSVFPTESFSLPQQIHHKKLDHPLWISSMTGGSSESGKINRTLAKIVKEFGLGMGLGSCRIIIKNPKTIKDFKLKPILKNAPFWANLGICEIAELLHKKQWNSFYNILGELEVDGLIVHINPTQEYLQPEGSKLTQMPINILRELLAAKPIIPIMVKEVGQGMGPKSLKALSQMSLQGIELGAMGGTNFSQVELMRRAPSKLKDDPLINLTKLGHSAKEMIVFWTMLQKQVQTKELSSWHIIISGGRGHDVIADVALFKMLKKTQHNASIGLGYSILKQAYHSEKLASQWIRHYLKAFYYTYCFTDLMD